MKLIKSLWYDDKFENLRIFLFMNAINAFLATLAWAFLDVNPVAFFIGGFIFHSICWKFKLPGTAFCLPK